MNCSQAMELILEADVVELAGHGDSELSAHIRECSGCSASVRQILSQQEMLQRLLAAESPNTAIDIALARAGKRAGAASRSRRLWQAAIPLAAAASLTGILLGYGARNSALDPAWQVQERRASIGLDIETPPGQNVAVFEVEDRPDIVVVWFYDQGD